MKILLVGGTGTIGAAVHAELSARHEVIVAGSKSGDIHVDMTSNESIAALYKKLGALDAVVVAAGAVHFGPLETMTEDAFYVGLKGKLMGQVNLVLQGQKVLSPNGSFTLTSGILAADPIRLGANASCVNGAIDSFVKSAAIELFNKGLRINSISPTVVVESMADYAPFFSGFKPVPAAEVALAYVKSIEGAQTGQVYRVGW